MDIKALGKRIKEERLRKGLTQEQLAEEVNITRLYVTFIENGNRTVRIDVLERISTSLDVSIEYLIKGSISTHEEIVYEFGQLINSCTSQEANQLLNVVKTSIQLIRK